MIVWRLESHDELASTSGTCIARAKAGEAEGLAVMAARQTAGRGSRGRNWMSAPGNLALSVLLRPGMDAAHAGVFSLLAGIAAVEAAEAFLPGGAFMLKWPNDILLGQAKLAGLLIDAAPLDHRIDWLVIGIGINLAHAPDIAGRATASLAQHGAVVEQLAAGEAVLRRLAHWLEVLATEGVAPVHQRWLQRAHPVGTQIVVRGMKETAAGRFAGLSAAGELLLSVDGRIEKFSTGEILLSGTD